MRRSKPNATFARLKGFEPLEARRLMAVDIGGLAGLDASPPLGSQPHVRAELVAEGEAAPAADLFAFAKAVATTQTKLYCADWSSSCAAQLHLFEDGGQFLPYVEVGNPNRTGNGVAASEGISSVPTWQFPDASRETLVLSLQEVSERSGVAIPFGTSPSMVPVPDATLTIESPLHIPIDAYDPNGEPLQFSVQVGNPELLSAEVLMGNRSLQLSTHDFGNMVFELFEQRAPRPAGRVIELAQAGFYDGVIFHRVVNNFVIQGGDPTGTGRGGSALGDFDDQFKLDLQHNATGMLSFAKSTDDTNDSQFFITEGQHRSLDFNHSVFGILVEGEAVRDAISNTATLGGGAPFVDIAMQTATVFDDTENAVLLLRGVGSTTGVTTVTVTATDPEGNAVQHTFQVTLTEDSINAAPFLDDVSPLVTTENTPIEVTLTSQDQEGDAVVYSVEPLGGIEFGVSVDEAGRVTVLPPTDFVGELQFRATVTQAAGTPTGAGSRDDNQVVRVRVHSAHQNQVNRLDVNADNFVTPLDALLIINLLNGNLGSGATSGLPAPPPLRDVNGDLFVSPVDVLLIVNHLNAASAADAEGESDGAVSSVLLASPGLHFTFGLPADAREKDQVFSELAAVDLVEAWPWWRR